MKRPNAAIAIACYALALAGGCFLWFAPGPFHGAARNVASEIWFAFVAIACVLLTGTRFPIGSLRDLTRYRYSMLLPIGFALAFVSAYFQRGQIAGHFPILAFGVLGAPAAEELLFRGVLQTGLNASIPATTLRGRVRVGTIVAAAIFGLTHAVAFFANRNALLTTGIVTSALIFGLVGGYLYERTDNLWLPLSVHIMGNLAGF